jgi:uncharacterized protein YbjT (DUF2867 family)
MTTVLVTGSTGDVGTNVVRELRGESVAVRAFVRDPDRAAALLGPDVPLAIGDFGEPESIRQALEGVDRVFLACANDPRQVEYETNVIDAAADASVVRVVKLSAVGAEKGSPLDFWDWQGRIEEHLRASGLPSVILRPTSYMTKLLGSPEAIKHSGKLFAPAGDAKISLIDPRDVASVAAVALTQDGHEGRTYVLSGPEAITFAEIAEELSSATGRPVEYVDVPDEAARQGMLQAGLPEWLADNLVTLFRLIRQGAASEITDTVRELTGRAPHSFAAFARANREMF